MTVIKNIAFIFSLKIVIGLKVEAIINDVTY
jgi:hypothetical protein